MSATELKREELGFARDASKRITRAGIPKFKPEEGVELPLNRWYFAGEGKEELACVMRFRPFSLEFLLHLPTLPAAAIPMRDMHRAIHLMTGFPLASLRKLVGHDHANVTEVFLRYVKPIYSSWLGGDRDPVKVDPEQPFTVKLGKKYVFSVSAEATDEIELVPLDGEKLEGYPLGEASTFAQSRDVIYRSARLTPRDIDLLDPADLGRVLEVFVGFLQPYL